MKTPDTSKPVSSVPDSANSIGNFPKRRNTVTAEVLMQLLDGKSQTGMDAVFAANTTRLAAKIHDLIHKHHWGISKREERVKTNDGRITEICIYYLERKIIEAAMQAGGREFCDSVNEARAMLRSSPQQLPSGTQ